MGETEGVERFALLKDAQIELRKEVCARGMGLRSNYTAMKDAEGREERFALLKDAQIMPEEEVCAGGMGLRSNYAATKDAQINLRREEYALNTGQSANCAAKKDVQIRFREEECALGMGQSANYAAKKDAQTGLRLEEYALNMGQSANYAAQKDVEVMFRKEGCATSIGQWHTQTMDLVHSDQNLNKLLQLNLNPMISLQVRHLHHGTRIKIKKSSLMTFFCQEILH